MAGRYSIKTSRPPRRSPIPITASPVRHEAVPPPPPRRVKQSIHTWQVAASIGLYLVVEGFPMLNTLLAASQSALTSL